MGKFSYQGINDIVLSKIQTDSPLSDGTDAWPFPGSGFLLQTLFLRELKKLQSCVLASIHSCHGMRAHSRLTTAAQDKARVTQTAPLEKIIKKETCATQEHTGFYFTSSYSPISNVLRPFWSCAKWIPPLPWGISFLLVRKEERQSTPTCC